MKKNSLLKLLSLAILVGGLAKVSTLGEKTFKSDEEFVETTKSFSAFNDHSKAFELGSPKRASEGEDLLASEVKVQISDVDENGKRSIRYVAAISSLDVDAKFVRTIYNEDGTVFQASKELDVQYAYDSIMSGDNVVYPSSYGEGYNYFIVYTLGNVPESHWYSRIDVQVAVNSEESERKANIEGLMSLDSNLKYEDMGNGEYQVESISNDITTARVDKYYKTYEDVVATRLGKVTTLKNGAFDGCDKLESISLPDSITSFNERALRYCGKLTSLDLPLELKTIGSNALAGLDSLKEVHFYSKNLSTTSVGIGNLENLYIYSSVESIPASLFSGSIDNVTYNGTKSQWEELSNSQASGNYGIEDSFVVCEDTQSYLVTFHFDGASITIDGNVYSNSYSFEQYEGSIIKDIGTPSSSNLKFDGWYTSPECLDETSVNFATKPLVNGEMHFYAKFIASQPGMSFEDPIILNDGFKQTITTTESMPWAYLSFTPSVTDIYYLRDNSASGFDSKTWLYDENQSELAANDDGSGNSRFFIGYLLEAGKTYTFKAGYYSTTVSSTFKYGSMNIEFFSKIGDRLEEAIELEIDTTVNEISAPGHYMYYKFTPKTDETAVRINRFTIGSSTTANYALVKLLDIEGNSISDCTFTSTKKSFDVNLEVGNSYIFAVMNSNAKDYSKGQSKGVDYSFKLEKIPAGLSASNPIVYTLNDGTVSVDYSIATSVKYNTNYYHTTIYYSFTAEESFVGTFSFNSTTKGATVKITNGSTSIYSIGSNYSGSSSGSKEITFVAGQEYSISFMSVTSTASAKPTSVTSFSIVKNEVVEPEEPVEPETPLEGSSIENPLVVELKENTNVTVGSLTGGVAKYFKFETSSSWNILSFSSNVKVKLYRASDLETPIYESSSYTKMVDFSDGYDAYYGEFVIEVTSSSDVEKFTILYQYY